MARNTHGLGRGLDSLFQEVEAWETSIQEIPVGELDPNPDQPRRTFHEESIAQLADSIRDVENIRRELWVAFDDISAYRAASARLEDFCFEHQGHLQVVAYLRKEKAVKRLPRDLAAAGDEETLALMYREFGLDNVKQRILGL